MNQIPPHNPAVDARAPAWLAVISLAVGAFSTVTTEFLPIGLLTSIAASLGVTEGTAGLMVTLPAVIAAFAGPALIIASGKLDRRSVLIALSTILVLSNALAAVAPNFETMLVARVLLGLCVGGFWTFAPGATTHLVPVHLQGRAVSYVLAGISVATVVGVPTGALIGNLAGWRTTFASAAVLSAAVLVLQLRLLPAMPPARATQARDLLIPLRHPASALGLVVTVLLVAGHFSAYTYLTPLLQHEFGLPATAVTSLLLLFGVAGFVGTFLGGRLVAFSVRGTTMFAAGAMAAVLILSVFATGGMTAGVLVAAVWGMAFSLIPVSMTAWMLQALPDAPEAGQALLVTAFQVAIASGALFGGRLVDNFGIDSALWLGGSLAGLAAIVIATSLVRRKSIVPAATKYAASDACG